MAERGATMRYRVIIADNFHYMDASEHVDGGEFNSYEAAVTHAFHIVDASLRSFWTAGMTAEDLMAQYVMFGDDPFILPAVEPLFSARDYARGRAPTICEEMSRS